MLLDTIKKAVLRLFPELSAGLHLDRYARVTAVNDAPEFGSASERFRPRYSVELTILTPDLEPDPAYPVYSAVPLPTPFGAGEEGGMFSFPQPGALAVIGFAYGRPDHPIIRQVYPQGFSLPRVGPGEILLQQGPEVFARADEAGNWTRQARFAIAEKSQSRSIETLSYRLKAANEAREISQHSVTEVEGVSRLEAALVDILGALKIDLGTLGELNLTAGSDSSFSTAGDHTETVGKNLTSVVYGDSSGEVAGALNLDLGGDATFQIGGSLSLQTGADAEVAISGNHTLTAASSSETIAGDKTITAEGAATLAGGSAALIGSGAAIALGGGISITGTSESGESVSIFDELLACLDNILLAESELAKGTTASGALVGSPGPYITEARVHWGNVGRVI